MLRKILLVCGILSSLFYVAANIVAVMLYPGYSAFSGTVSELSAIGAPTRSLWVWLMVPYSLLVIAFGWGVWMSAGRNRPLRVVGSLMVASALFGFTWPPMHQREVLAMGGGSLTDTLHIVWTIVASIVFLLVLGFGAAALGKWFRLYSIATMVVLVAFGALTGMHASGIEANLPTPWIGVWERINIGAYMLWVAVLGIALLRAQMEGSRKT